MHTYFLDSCLYYEWMCNTKSTCFEPVRSIDPFIRSPLASPFYAMLAIASEFIIVFKTRYLVISPILKKKEKGFQMRQKY